MVGRPQPARQCAGALGRREDSDPGARVLNGFSEIFTALFQKSFAVENPFLWMTKAQVVRSIRDAGCGDLIKHAVSCTHVWTMTTLKTHCGVCPPHDFLSDVLNKTNYLTGQELALSPRGHRVVT